MRERIKGVMAGVFAIPVQELSDDGSIDGIPQWDSLCHIELMLALETEFGIRISSEAMLELVSLKAIEEYLEAHESSRSR